MKTLKFMLVMAFASASALAQNDYEKQMEDALRLHTNAKTFSEEKSAEQAFINIAEQHKDWLAYFWASYINTQLFNALRNPDANPPKETNPVDILKNAQHLLDQASTLVDRENSYYLSDIAALQILVYQFKLQLSQDDAERNELAGLMGEALKKAVALNNENPMVYVLVGTNMVGSGDKLSQVLAGKVLLQEAHRLFKLRKSKRSLSTHFNEEWLDMFWLEFSKQQLEKKATS